ncbi:single-stranded DNA-binding protein [Buchananella felis]|uniref:single-stranded DNA-binding protein n=1 Tax=Buchananella felis TaxID=3231492 RepID=UPI0035287623
MSNPIEITVHGYAATNASLLRSEGRPDLAEFRIAATPRYRTAEGWKDLDTEFITVKAWREAAQDVASSVRKGMPLVVIGRLATERWERAGSTQTSVVIHASSISVEVKRGVVTYARVVDRNSGRPQEENAQSSQMDDAAAPTPPSQSADGAPTWATGAGPGEGNAGPQDGSSVPQDGATAAPRVDGEPATAGGALRESGVGGFPQGGAEAAPAAADRAQAPSQALEDAGGGGAEFTSAELEYELQSV